MLQGLGSMVRESPKRTGAKRRSVDTIVRFVRTYLGLPRARVGVDEPPPPAGPGSYTREVDMRDGSVKWVKSNLKVIK